MIIVIILIVQIQVEREIWIIVLMIRQIKLKGFKIVYKKRQEELGHIECSQLIIIVPEIVHQLFNIRILIF